MIKCSVSETKYFGVAFAHVIIPAEHKEAALGPDFCPPEVTAGEWRFKQDKATGSDGIPGHLLKCCADILAASVATLFNASLVNGTVPTAFKLAHVIPLFKAGDPSIPTNFRPVSLLPILSKLLEKVVQKKLAQFLDISGTLPTTQFAFRAGHSTEDALVLMLNRILIARDKRLCTGICLLDMSKAFDKVRHERTYSISA